MARKPYSPRRYRPHKSTVKSLKFNPCWRCTQCGTNYTKQDCKTIFGESKPTQCQCGSITFEHFHSTSEAQRFATLLLLQSRGKISNLEKQVRFPLFTISPEGLRIKVCDYIADFEYNDDKGLRVVEEHKGGLTAVAELKLKWFERQYGFKPLITGG